MDTFYTLFFFASQSHTHFVRIHAVCTWEMWGAGCGWVDAVIRKRGEGDKSNHCLAAEATVDAATLVLATLRNSTARVLGHIIWFHEMGVIGTPATLCA